MFVEGKAVALPAAYALAAAKLRERFASERPKLATRQASQQVLDGIAGTIAGTVGGSADLTHSNLTHAKVQVSVKRGAFAGDYIHYGIREHGMAAAMNGLALHGGFIPYGGTFTAFSDYSRPAIRLAALMRLRVIHVMTHDSIGLGEDGPTHQPVEHLVALRVIPNLWCSAPPTRWRRWRHGTARSIPKTAPLCCASRVRRCRPSAAMRAAKTVSLAAPISSSRRTAAAT